VAVVNASYKWGYIFVCFALLLDVMYRGAVRHEAAWELLALVVMGGAVCAIYQAKHKALRPFQTKGCLLVLGVTLIVVVVLAIILAMIGRL
jgi:hypothetical protein